MRYDTSRIVAMYEQLLEKLPGQLFEDMQDVRVHILNGLHKSERSFGRCGWRPVRIELAVELNLERRCVIRGVLAHEIAHALTLIGSVAPPDDWNDFDAVERYTDQVAEDLFGDHIYYDKRGVQCMGKGAHGTRPRPEGL